MNNTNTTRLTVSDLHIGGLYHNGSIHYGVIAINPQSDTITLRVENSLHTINHQITLALSEWLDNPVQKVEIDETNVTTHMLFREKTGSFRQIVSVDTIDCQNNFISIVYGQGAHQAYSFEEFFKLYEFVGLSQEQLEGHYSFVV